jgi:hypothetical protein
MTPEDFTSPNNGNHPEVSGTPLEMQRPEQVTLRHLLSDITNISANGYEHSDSIGISVHYPDSQYGAASIRRFKDRASRDDPNRLAGITHIDRVGDNGDEVITNYFILDSPDGLQIEKHSHTSNPSKEMLREGASLDEIGAAALNGLAKIAEMKKSQVEEDEMGLSFVSEQEARDLLKLLSDTVPFEKRA